MFNVLAQKYKGRIHQDHAETPEWLLVLCTLFGVLIPLCYLYLLQLAAPSYLDLAARVAPGDWGWQGLSLTFVLGVLGVLTWNTAALALHCAKLLRDRWSS